MRVRCKFVLVMSLLAATAFAGSAAAAAARPGEDTPAEMLSPQQGQGLAEFALQYGRGLRPRPDCSHLVHKMYTLAGLSYSYAESRQLYAGGADEFERVTRPQPGDLVVWRGHVGIVVSPEDRTFLSSVRSGIIVEAWTAPYWKRRGRPRFFRYLVGPQTDRALLASLTMPQDDSDERPAARRKPAAGRERTVAEASPPAMPSSSSDEAAPETFAGVAVIHQRGKPGKREVAVALSQGGNARSLALTGRQLLDVGHPVSVVDRMEVKKIKIKRDAGTITLKLTETVALEAGKVISGKTVERQLRLDRRQDSWVITDPWQRTYIPREQAVSVFERQAELYLQKNSSGRRMVIKALDALYDREPAASQKSTTEARRRGEEQVDR